MKTTKTKTAHWFDEAMQKAGVAPAAPNEKKQQGGIEQATFTDACILNIIADTTGVDGGDCSQHEIMLDFEGTSTFEVSLDDRRPVDASKIRLRLKGDAEARTMQQACQMISQFFLKHHFHESG